MTLTREEILDHIELSVHGIGYFRLLKFCEQVESKEPPDPQFLEDLAAAFRKMLAEESLKKRPAVFRDEMNLKGKGGRPSTEGDEHWAYAVQVFLLMEKGAPNITKAVEDVAKLVHKSETTVGKAATKHEASAKSTAKYFLKVERDFAYFKSLISK